MTHLFSGGTILATARCSYDGDLEESVVRQFMQSQHKNVLRQLKHGEYDERIRGALPGAELPQRAATPPSPAQPGVSTTPMPEATAPAARAVNAPEAAIGAENSDSGPTLWIEPDEDDAGEEIQIIEAEPMDEDEWLATRSELAPATPVPRPPRPPAPPTQPPRPTSWAAPPAPRPAPVSESRPRTAAATRAPPARPAPQQPRPLSLIEAIQLQPTMMDELPGANRRTAPRLSPPQVEYGEGGVIIVRPQSPSGDGGAPKPTAPPPARAEREGRSASALNDLPVDKTRVRVPAALGPATARDLSREMTRVRTPRPAAPPSTPADELRPEGTRSRTGLPIAPSPPRAPLAAGVFPARPTAEGVVMAPPAPRRPTRPSIPARAPVAPPRSITVQRTTPTQDSRTLDQVILEYLAESSKK